MIFLGLLCGLAAVTTLLIASVSVTSSRDLTKAKKNSRTVLILMVLFWGCCRLSAYTRYDKDLKHYNKYGSHLYQQSYYVSKINTYNNAKIFSFYTADEISFYRSTTNYR